MKRLPLLLLAVGCWSSVGVLATDYPWEIGGLDKRSAEEGDCLEDCKKDTTLSIQACLQKCKITKRTPIPFASVKNETLSAQEPPPQPVKSNRSYFMIGVDGDPPSWLLDKDLRQCTIKCLLADYKLSVCSQICNYKRKKRSTEDEKVSAQDPTPQPWQVNGPGKRSAAKNSCWSDCLERGRPYRFCAVECGCYPPFCDHGKRSVEDEQLSAQDPPPQPWQVNGPGKRSADGSCWTNCVARGDSTEKCAKECGPSGEHPIDQRSVDPPEPQQPQLSPAKKEHECLEKCLKDRKWCLFPGGFGALVRKCDTRWDCRAKCHEQVYGSGKRSVEDEPVPAQDPSPQPWQVNGHGKRSIEETRGL